MNRLRIQMLALALVLLPGLAAVCAFDLPNLSFPDSGAPATQGCAQPATLMCRLPGGQLTSACPWRMRGLHCPRQPGTR